MKIETKIFLTQIAFVPTLNISILPILQFFFVFPQNFIFVLLFGDFYARLILHNQGSYKIKSKLSFKNKQTKSYF
jgi:hypothetical protein